MKFFGTSSHSKKLLALCLSMQFSILTLYIRAELCNESLIQQLTQHPIHQDSQTFCCHPNKGASKRAGTWQCCSHLWVQVASPGADCRAPGSSHCCWRRAAGRLLGCQICIACQLLPPNKFGKNWAYWFTGRICYVAESLSYGSKLKAKCRKLRHVSKVPKNINFVLSH